MPFQKPANIRTKDKAGALDVGGFGKNFYPRDQSLFLCLFSSPVIPVAEKQTHIPSVKVIQNHTEFGVSSTDLRNGEYSQETKAQQQCKQTEC